MAAPVVQAQRPQSVGRPPNLPIIEHPMARLGSKKHLNIIGSNQGGLVSDTSMHYDQEEGHQDDFEPGGASLPSLREKKHARNPTWPAEQNRRSTVDVIIRRRQDPEKLYNIIRDRLSSHFNVFQQQFRANDPQGRGAVSKGAFSRVLYHLIGFVAMEDVGKLLDWLGINSADGISFNQFVSAFRDSETSSRRWVYTPLTPKEAPSRSKAPFLEDHLCKPAQDGNLDYITASYANAYLKEECKHSDLTEVIGRAAVIDLTTNLDFDLRDHLLNSCFEPGALILAPQLQHCLESLGVPLDDEEMEILWSRYDLQNTGAVDAAWFFEQIGLDKFGRYLPRVRTATPRSSRSWGIPSLNDVVESPLPERHTPRVPSRSARTPSPDQPRPPSTDVISSLMRKMEQTYFSMLMSCEHFDYNHNGMMSKAQLKEILREYGIPMYPYDMEQLLERCNLRRKDQYVSYKDFLHKFMIRSPQGIAHRVIMDPQHSFTNRMATPAGNLSAEDAEAKLVEMLHKDFLKLLGTFQVIDPHTLHLVTQNQFREAINKVFNMKVTNQQFHQLLQEVGTTPEGLVPYPEFLAIFNKKRYPAPNVHNNSKLAVEGGKHSPLDQGETVEAAVVPVEYPPVQQQPDKVTVKTDELLDRRRAVMEGRFRAVHQIANIVEEKLMYNRLEAKQAFEKLDAKKTGRISRTQLHYWLQELGLVLHPTELQNLWRALKTGRDGLVHQGELLEFFTRAERRKPLLDQQAAMKRFRNTYNDLPDYHNGLRRSKFNLPRDEPSTQRDSLGSPNLDTLGKLRPQVVKHWDELKEILRDLDPDGYGTVDSQEFKNVCHYMKFPLSEEQLTKLCLQFDFNHNNQFHYLQFMQMFAPSSVLAERQHSTKYDKNIHKIVYQGSKGVVEESVSSVLQKINKQLMKEWKNLRRAFKQADLDKDGFLDVVEFKSCIRKIIKDIKEDDLFYVLSELDANMDGKISYDEFLTHFQGA